MNLELQKTADRFADRLLRMNAKYAVPIATAGELRDLCDIVTGGELDCVQLDIFCDMVSARIRKGLSLWERHRAEGGVLAANLHINR